MSKADNLRILATNGFKVPSFSIIPAEVFNRFRETLPQSVSAQSIKDAALPESAAKEILKFVRQVPADNLAVRSSMAGEDSAQHSFAGQLDSFLNVRGDENILTAIKDCWASAYNERGQIYRQQHKLSTENLNMEVIIQVMVPADVSGVLFTADPNTGNPNWMVISAAKGLGEALVQGKVDGDTWMVGHESGDVKGAGDSLTKDQILILVEIAKKIESLFGSPQDIEFAWANDEFFILQARPITTPISNRKIDQRDEYILWDNSNITESYSGVTTPLTYSVIRDAYAQVYHQFLELMGAYPSDESFLRNLLGLYQGRVYYQLFNWHKALARLPAFEQNRQLMEQMMGVKQKSGTEIKGNTGGKLALAKWILRMLYLHVTGEQRVQSFLTRFNLTLSEYQAKDLDALSPHQLHAAYTHLNKRALGEWRAPILTDFFAMIFFGTLRRMSERWFGSGGSLHNDLMAGDGSIESLEPLRLVQDLAKQVRENSQLRAAFSGDPAKVLEDIRTSSQFASFHAEFDKYLRLYGDRCMNELKLEEPNLRDNPTRLIKMISAAIDNPINPGQATNVRINANARLAQLSFKRRFFFDLILRYTQRHVRNRENMRFARTRLFGLVRQLINAIGLQWEKAGVLEHTEDIYYLTIHEIWDFIDGTAVTQNLRGLITLRQIEYSHHKQITPPDRFETFGAPYLYKLQDLPTKAFGDDNILHGIGCCSGHVRSRARVVNSMDDLDDLKGDILVAERTDPGWIFLFPSASGILVERGSPLSHSAIVARELGKPTIVNIPNLTKFVHTGNEIEMDGETGIIRVIKL